MAIRGGLRLNQLGVTLLVRDVAAAADFYRDVLGAEEIRRNFSLVPGGAPGPEALSAELRLGDAYLIVSRENPRWAEAPRPDWPRAPQSAGGPSACFTLYVADVDAVLARAIAAGASQQTADGPQDTFWGDRVVQFHDPAGHVWRIQTRLEDVEADALPARPAAARARHRASRTGDGPAAG
ncbi:hypothetical protein STVA_24900 [Allostella vacuolata]|nr:hypothetical protein STVA_24900 [Stella vacuolata]